MTSSSIFPLLAALLRHYEELVAHVRRGPVARWGDRGMAREVVHDVDERRPAAPKALAPAVRRREGGPALRAARFGTF
ncbi:MAG: hypothetical protein QM772_01955 [Ottowia sp.]|uniref:hypothetical protein n=1 Tax=Ottowia sp. TaxID=1898956 RepID=UPI0039E56B9A